MGLASFNRMRKQQAEAKKAAAVEPEVIEEPVEVIEEPVEVIEEEIPEEEVPEEEPEAEESKKPGKGKK